MPTSIVKRFRKKPVEIEAVRFAANLNQHGMDMLVSWMRENGGDAHHDGTSIYINTLEGQMRADVGDYIIRGLKGEFYPCKPDIFQASYDPAD